MFMMSALNTVHLKIRCSDPGSYIFLFCCGQVCYHFMFCPPTVISTVSKQRAVFVWSVMSPSVESGLPALALSTAPCAPDTCHIPFRTRQISRPPDSLTLGTGVILLPGPREELREAACKLNSIPPFFRVKQQKTAAG